MALRLGQCAIVCARRMKHHRLVQPGNTLSRHVHTHHHHGTLQIDPTNLEENVTEQCCVCTSDCYGYDPTWKAQIAK